MMARILETNVLHASDIISWLDGTTGQREDGSDMQRVERVLAVVLSERPSDLGTLQKPGVMVLWRRPVTPMVEGEAGEAQLQRPAATPYTLNGVLDDPEGLFNPQRFELTVGGGNGHSLTVYRSLLGTRFGAGGGLVGSARFTDNDKPAAWSLLDLLVTTSPNSTVRFRAQANGAGDFRMSMGRLPPLSENVAHYDAKLTLRANTAADPSQPLNLDTLSPMQLGDLAQDATFHGELPLTVKPGHVTQIKSANREYLAVKSAG